MSTKAKRFDNSSDPESTGVSILWVPDPTFKILSDAAAERNMTVASLITEAVAAYLLGDVKSARAEPPKPPESPKPAGKKKPKLMRFD